MLLKLFDNHYYNYSTNYSTFVHFNFKKYKYFFLPIKINTCIDVGNVKFAGFYLRHKDQPKAQIFKHGYAVKYDTENHFT